jgi:hypothetical protein
MGTSMSWWWEDVHADHAYPLYTVLRDIMARAGWDDADWSPATVATSGPPPFALGDPADGGEPFNATIPLNQLRLNPVPGSAAIADPLAAARAAERISSYLHGARQPHLQQHARLLGWFADNARLVFRVNSVAADADLLVRIDDKEALRVPLKDQDGLAALNDEINQEFAVPIPAGRHHVEIAHTGVDWVNLRSVRLERVQPAPFTGVWAFAPEAIGLQREDNATVVVYVRSPHVAWPAGATRYNPPLVSGAAVTLTNWPARAGIVAWMDPSTGRNIASTPVARAGGDTRLPLPDFNDDLVGILTAEPGR